MPPIAIRPSAFRLLPLAAALLGLGAAAVVQATPLPAYPTAASGPSTTSWYPDRFPPAGFANVGAFAGRENVLALTLSADDAAANRDAAFTAAFYNTQGRKIDVGQNGPISWIGSLYIPASWGTPSTADATGSRRSDLWATVSPATGGDTCMASNCNLFPIFGFSNAVFPDASGAVGGTPRYRVFDGNNGGWNDLATAVAYDAWTDFCVTFTGTSIEYRIGDALVYTMTNITPADTGFGPVTQLANVMTQAYNYNEGYTANWSWLSTGTGTCSQLRAEFAPPPPPILAARPVPVGPFGAIGAALAVAFAAFLRRRKP